MNKYEEALKTHKSQRKAAKSLGISRMQFVNALRKIQGLCVVSGCKRPLVEGRTRCAECLVKARSKKTKHEIQEKNKLYYEKNRDRLLAYNKTYQKKNLPRFREARKKYDQTELGRISSERRRARRLAIPDTPLSRFELEFVKNSLGVACFGCGKSGKMTLDHFIPLSKGGKLTIDNTCLLCSRCNSSKRDSWPGVYFSKEKMQLWSAHRMRLLKYIVVDSPTQYDVRLSSQVSDCRNFLLTHHYTKTAPSSSYYFTLEYEGRVLGVMSFSKPSRQNIRAPFAAAILELSRLFVVDGTPKNTESYFIGAALKYLKKHTKIDAIVSFADPTVGHVGTIYKASNFCFLGKTRENYHYLDSSGKRVHKRQVWTRAQQNRRSETEQAATENLVKSLEEPKNKYAFYFLKLTKQQKSKILTLSGG